MRKHEKEEISKGVYRVIVIPDLQYPFICRKSLEAVEEYMAAHRWDEYLCLGDLMDFDQLSRWNKDSAGKIAGRQLSDDYRGMNEILDRHQKILRKRNPDAKFTITLGNHDIRPEKYAQDFPQFRGTIEIEHGLRLKERGFKIVRCYPDGDVYKIGKAHFIHGIYAGSNHAKKTVDSFGCNVFTGHSHSVQMHSKMLWGDGSAIVGQSLGCLCDYNLEYVGKNPKDWQKAVTTFFFTKDGNFSYYVSRIFRGRFVGPDGKVYGK